MVHAGVLMKIGAFGVLRVAIMLCPLGWIYWAKLMAVLAAIGDNLRGACRFEADRSEVRDRILQRISHGGSRPRPVNGHRRRSERRGVSDVCSWRYDRPALFIRRLYLRPDPYEADPGTWRPQPDHAGGLGVFHRSGAREYGRSGTGEFLGRTCGLYGRFQNLSRSGNNCGAGAGRHRSFHAARRAEDLLRP